MEQDKSAIERHAQTIISAVALALLLWFGATLVDVQNRVVRIEAYNVARNDNSAEIKSEIAELRKRMTLLEMEHAKGSK